jgi:aminoglycoside 6'-N-acetyltransferase I
MAEPRLRLLALADRPAWAALRLALWPNHSATELGDELAEMLDGDFAGIGCFDGDRLIGFAEVAVRSYGDGCEFAPAPWLEAVYVLPAHRRQGIGRQLVAAVEAWARARGFVELGSDAEFDNLTSRLSHALWGFTETGRTVLFRKALK